MKTRTNLGRAGSPLPAARLHKDCGAHGVTRPTQTPALRSIIWLLHGCVLAALIALTGCTTPIGADLATPRQAYLNLQRNALNSDDCSGDALVVLHRYNLETLFKKNPDATLKKLQAIACADDRRDVLYALSELNYLNAEGRRRNGGQ